MSWVSSTLFNLVLILDPFGRLALNKKEKQSAVLCGLCILGALGIGLYGAVAFWDGPAAMIDLYWMAAAPMLGLAIPISASFQYEGKRQRLMQLYSGGLLVLIVGAIYFLEQDDLRFKDWWQWSVQGVVLSTWLGLGAAVVPQRK